MKKLSDERIERILEINNQGYSLESFLSDDEIIQMAAELLQLRRETAEIKSWAKSRTEACEKRIDNRMDSSCFHDEIKTVTRLGAKKEAFLEILAKLNEMSPLPTPPQESEDEDGNV